MIILGFTGTRRGMSPAQKRVFFETVKLLDVQIFVHGDCIGADADAHEIVREISPDIRIEARPAGDGPNRAYKKADIVHASHAPLSRNKKIVESVEQMIACPGEQSEILRSGTWSTIRYTKKLLKPLLIIYPNGTKEFE